MLATDQVRTIRGVLELVESIRLGAGEGAVGDWQNTTYFQLEDTQRAAEAISG